MSDIRPVDARPDLPGLAGQTPDELWRAHRATGGPVKLFPADLGGPRYLRAMLAPLPQLAVLPSGGIELEDVDAWLAAGAIAVSLGSSLCPPGALERRDSGPISERASRLSSLVRA